jgi:Holliday junction resolvasome RuvABC endonuclease subunit
VERTRDAERVIAIDPTHRGFGFVVLEGEAKLLDWGTRHAPHPKEYNTIEKVDQLIDRYEPRVLVLENPKGEGSRRCLRVQQLIEKLVRLGQARGLAVFQYSRAEVRLAFASEGARTKQEIAVVLAERFPELAPRVPPARKLWMSEDHRMAIFDAASLAVTHLS